MHNFPAVEVRLTFPPIVTAYFDEWDAIADEAIPAPPRPYGNSLLSGITPFLRRSAVGSIAPVLSSQSYIEQASRTIHFAPFHLRPGARERLDTVHLILDPEIAGKELVGQWSATSTGVSGQASGAFTIQVADTPATWRAADLTEEENNSAERPPLFVRSGSNAPDLP